MSGVKKVRSETINSGFLWTSTR